MVSKYFQVSGVSCVGDHFGEHDVGVFRVSETQLGWRSQFDNGAIVVDVCDIIAAIWNPAETRLDLYQRHTQNPYMPWKRKSLKEQRLSFRGFTNESVEDLAFFLSAWFNLTLRYPDMSAVFQFQPPRNNNRRQRDRGVLKEGWVYKRSRFLRVWRKRWFVLCLDGTLCSFESPHNLITQSPTEQWAIYDILDAYYAGTEETPGTTTYLSAPDRTTSRSCGVTRDAPGECNLEDANRSVPSRGSSRGSSPTSSAGGTNVTNPNPQRIVNQHLRLSPRIQSTKLSMADDVVSLSATALSTRAPTSSLGDEYEASTADWAASSSQYAGGGAASSSGTNSPTPAGLASLQRSSASTVRGRNGVLGATHNETSRGAIFDIPEVVIQVRHRKIHATPLEQESSYIGASSISLGGEQQPEFSLDWVQAIRLAREEYLRKRGATASPSSGSSRPPLMAGPAGGVLGMPATSMDLHSASSAQSPPVSAALVPGSRDGVGEHQRGDSSASANNMQHRSPLILRLGEGSMTMPTSGLGTAPAALSATSSSSGAGPSASPSAGGTFLQPPDAQQSGGGKRRSWTPHVFQRMWNSALGRSGSAGATDPTEAHQQYPIAQQQNQLLGFEAPGGAPGANLRAVNQSYSNSYSYDRAGGSLDRANSRRSDGYADPVPIDPSPRSVGRVLEDQNITGGRGEEQFIVDSDSRSGNRMSLQFAQQDINSYEDVDLRDYQPPSRNSVRLPPPLPSNPGGRGRLPQPPSRVADSGGASNSSNTSPQDLQHDLPGEQDQRNLKLYVKEPHQQLGSLMGVGMGAASDSSSAGNSPQEADSGSSVSRRGSTARREDIVFESRKNQWTKDRRNSWGYVGAGTSTSSKGTTGSGGGPVVQTHRGDVG
ncbi:unnamed protein product [Amoebophrya sp. A25]|nr:unnamed protein product [Amoebophrya sp. A25]|eukprot:GSA25T00021991001.1